MMTRRDGLHLLASGLAAAPFAAGAAPPAPTAPDGSGAPVARFVLEALVDLTPMEDLGTGPFGGRRIVPIVGGTFQGPDIRGRVRPGGADRQVKRPDGILELHALYELETDDGAVITVSNNALIDAPEGGPRYALSTPVLTAPEGKYGWLNRRIFTGTVGPAPRPHAVRIRIFQLG